jgi:Holliday junction resolvase RusA-like endonuclease
MSLAIDKPKLATYRLEFRGPVPSKKNRLRRSRNGGIFREAGATEEINELLRQASLQWKRKPPIEHVVGIAATFYVRNGKADADNKYTTLQDVLVKAGVIRNDSIARVPAFSVSTERADEERTEVEIAVENAPGAGGRR